MTSARLNSSISASEYAITACCSLVRSCGFARNAMKRAASRCGTGCAARSRWITVASGLRSRHCATKRSASRLDSPPVEKRLLLIWSSVGIVVSWERGRCLYLTIDRADKKAQLLGAYPSTDPMMAQAPKISLDHWRSLAAVVDAGGYAQAAKSLHKSQSSVTYAVQQVESQLGVKAFRIDGRKAVLTPTGQLLYRRARALLDEADR